MKRKRFLVGIALATVFALASTLMLPGLVGTSMAAQSYIQVKVNGVELQGEVQPVIINGYTMVPMRDIFEALGAELVWDPDMAMVGARKGDTLVKLRINSKEAWIGMKSVKLDIAPMIVDMHTMVPVRFIAQSLGEKVEWDKANRIVYIGSKTPLPKEKPEDTNYIKEYTLSASTELAYGPGRTAMFQAGTLVKMRSKDYVQSGTLAQDCFLYYKEGKSQARFSGGDEVTFNKQGYVESGTLAVDNSFEYAPIDDVDINLIPKKDRNQLVLKEGTPVKFSDRGYVVEGTLVDDGFFQYDGRSAAMFKYDTTIRFAENGRVLKGTLKEPIYLPYRINKMLNFKAGTTIEFYDNNFVKSGTLSSDSKLETNSRNEGEVEFKKDTLITFNTKGYVQSGTLKENTALPYRESCSVQFKSDTVISFHDNGYVSGGTLCSATSLLSVSGSYRSVLAGNTVQFDLQGKVMVEAK